MASNHGCINNSLDGVDYSSPVPVIGLYIAGASVACLVMMFWDIGFGIYARKRWLPCKVFKLDSVTLTLLGVVAKLPVDLTTSMPGRHDQLSKLTGTVIICISMGFLVPSLGASNESECQTNMVALTIFVITVAANICIQLGTGVIVLFIEEHIIILCLMLLLLMLLWHISLNIKFSKRLVADQYKDILAKGNNSMFGRLKLCYLYSYCSNPQYTMCKDPMYASISILCLLCSVTLMQATLRSVILRKVDFCSGAEDSDYGWSMPYVTITQIVTVIVGTIAIVFRWLALCSRMEFENLIVSFRGDDAAAQRNQTLGWWNRWQNFFLSLYMKTASATQLLIVSPSWLMRKLFGLYKHDRLEFFEELPHDPSLITASDYIVQKSISDIIKFRDDCKSKSITNLLQLLPRTPAPQRGKGYPEHLQRVEGNMKVCSLSVALLVKVAQVSLPEHYLGPLLCAYEEANEIIHFIDKTLQTKKSEDNDKLSYAKAVWTAGDFSCLLSDVVTDNQSDLNSAVAIIEHLQGKLESDNICSELQIMVDFINPKSYSSIEELYKSMKQMFLDMLRALFSQLPLAIYKSLSECQAEEFEECIQLAMKFLFLIQPTEPREDDIDWLCPPGTDIASFITDDTPVPTGSLKRLEKLSLPDDEAELIHGVDGV